MNLDDAIRLTEEALEEQYPGEFVDIDALRVLVDEVKRLRAELAELQQDSYGGVTWTNNP